MPTANFTNISSSPTATSSTTEVENGSRGQYTWEDQSAIIDGTRTNVDWYKRWNWWELEGPGLGDYSRGKARIDAYLASAAASGGKFGFRVIAYDQDTTNRQHTTNTPSGAYSCLPEYMTAAYCNCWAYTGSVTNVVPDWNDSNYIARWHAFLDWLAATYGNNPRLGFFDMSFSGIWSEGHMSGPANEDPPYTTWYTANAPSGQVWLKTAAPNNQADLANYHASALKNTAMKLVWQTQPRTAFQTAMQNTDMRIGIRADSFGQKESWSEAMSTLAPDFAWLQGVVGAGNTADPYERWKTAPVIVEWNSYTGLPSNTQASVFQNGYDQATGSNGITNYHVSMVSSGNWPGWTSSPPVEVANETLFNSVYTKVGYRLRISALSCSLASNGISVAVTWTNDGNAPTYVPWRVRFGITGPTVAETEFTQDLRNVLPGTPQQFTETIVTGLRSGTHGLYVRVVDAYGIYAPMKIAITNTRDSGGNYDLGTFDITDGHVIIGLVT